MQTKRKILESRYFDFQLGSEDHMYDVMDAWAKPSVDALKEAKELIEWMIKNMELNCPDRNHHSFMEHLGNAYMNTMHSIDEALKQYNQ